MRKWFTSCECHAFQLMPVGVSQNALCQRIDRYGIGLVKRQEIRIPAGRTPFRTALDPDDRSSSGPIDFRNRFIMGEIKESIHQIVAPDLYVDYAPACLLDFARLPQSFEDGVKYAVDKL